MLTQQLLNFITASDLNSINKAAVALNMSQQSLSKSIQALEQDLDCVLLERSNRGVNSTPNGQVIYDVSKSILAQWEDMLDDVQRLNSVSGEFCITFTPYVEMGFMTPVLGFFHHYFPEVHLIKQNHSLKIALDLLKQQKLDLVIGAHLQNFGDEWQDFTHVLIHRVPLAIKVNSQHPLAEKILAYHR